MKDVNISDLLKEVFVKLTGRPLMASTDWCKSFKKGKSNCDGCPNLAHCKLYCFVLMKMSTTTIMPGELEEMIKEAGF